MKPVWLLLGLVACTSNDDLPSGVTSSRTLATTTDITTDLAKQPPTTRFTVSVGTVGPDPHEVDDASVTVYADGADQVILQLHELVGGSLYEATRAGYAPSYSLFIRRTGQDYLDIDLDAPPPVAPIAQPLGIGQPVSLHWAGADPALYFTVRVTRDGSEIPISGQYLGANRDDGQYELPGLTFGEHGLYTVSVQRTRWIHWGDSFECEHDCAVLSSVRANTVSSATFTL